jgi:hypothetical protein
MHVSSRRDTAARLSLITRRSLSKPAPLKREKHTVLVACELSHTRTPRLQQHMRIRETRTHIPISLKRDISAFCELRLPLIVLTPRVRMLPRACALFDDSHSRTTRVRSVCPLCLSSSGAPYTCAKIASTRICVCVSCASLALFGSDSPQTVRRALIRVLLPAPTCRCQP